MELDLAASPHDAEIARSKPAILKRLLVFFRGFEITLKNSVSAKPDFAPLAGQAGLASFRMHDLSFQTRHRLAAGGHTAFKGFIGMIKRNHAARLG